ncbi:MAG: tRNA dihydrouridine synthase DusB [Candidatus Latescibacteria bacterium]|nr:tRNA dihydrouridine synthase DusB [Candidatus Latescibacterota bacterium]
MLKIGPVEVDPGLLLAPMEDVSDLPFRLVCKDLGADIVYTEFINSEGLVRQQQGERSRTWRKLEFSPAERPFGIQLYGAAELSMQQAARIADQRQPDIIDINCGCWVSNVALRGAGAGLLRDLPQMRQVVAAVTSATQLPVTVKTRLGWDSDSIQIIDVARMLEDLGVQALTLHCRTRAQGHKGTPDYSWIPRIKQAVSMPVILNGDICTPQDVQRAFAETGCDGVMIGRAAIQHPWIFREARHFLASGQLLPPPTLHERADRCLQHLHLATQHWGPRYGLIGLRRHYAGYFKGLPGASRLRQELSQYREPEPLTQRLLEVRESTAGIPQRSADLIAA